MSSLEPALVDAWERARSAWPGIDVPLEEYAAHLGARVSDIASLETVDTGDLYIACGCLHDSPGARELFSRALLPPIALSVQRFDPAPAFADEVRQRVAEKVLFGTSSTGPKLADYNGRGPLAAWLRVVAIRTALDLVASHSPARAQTLADAFEGMPEDDDPTLAYLRARYLPAYRDAIRAALAALTAQQRNVLRLQLVSRLTTERIATMFHVNQSTVVRWLATTRGEIRARAEASLISSLKVSPTELASLTRLILSRLDVSIVDLLS
ncbi:MAG TPA: sigma factor-like helix-turn-helix DNA-binding protein [Kofleriaceae bacterium]|nr:sigma factor-like helix-turn-helix DNA-binding protein [Kofleriaceae bacterium]